MIRHYFTTALILVTCMPILPSWSADEQNCEKWLSDQIVAAHAVQKVDPIAVTFMCLTITFSSFFLRKPQSPAASAQVNTDGCSSRAHLSGHSIRSPKIRPAENGLITLFLDHAAQEQTDRV